MEGPLTGHVVYFIAAGNFVKVGYSANVSRRQDQLQVGNPQSLRLVMTIGYPDEESALKAEVRWRDALRACGTQARGEWVELELDLIGPLVQRLQRPKWKTAAELMEAHSTDEDLLEFHLSYHHGLRARFPREI